jgi:hypothetical protein
LLLDDASTDESRSILNTYLGDPRVRPFYNAVNTGNPGKQWNRGVAEARGQYIWIAESDDYADTHFLEMMVTRLDGFPTAGLVYSQSWKVDADNCITGRYTYAIQDLDPKRWEDDYFNAGADETRYFAYENIIPNASAVLFRKQIYEQAGGANEQVRYGGDWLLWVNMLMISDVVFVAEPLNYYRQHPDALTANRNRTPSDQPARVSLPPPTPIVSSLDRWPARMHYILGRNALRMDNLADARYHLKQSLKIHYFPSTVLFLTASYLGRPVYKGLDGIKMRRPGLGRTIAKLNVGWLRLRRWKQK